jgi:hypothetical protein
MEAGEKRIGRKGTEGICAGQWNVEKLTNLFGAR